MGRLKRWIADRASDLYSAYLISPGLVTVQVLLLVVLILSVFLVPSVEAASIPTAAEQHRRTLVRAAHAEWGLGAPVATFAAQVHQESAWRVNARSPVGAEGLAQFMPATADWMAEIYPRSLGPAQPYNPGWALRAMVAFDRWLYERNQAVSECDRWAFVLAGYNGGNGWVNRDRRLASAKGADPLAWFDSVERHNAGRSAANFRENRHYPRAILLRWEPMYAAAGWGVGVCAERYSRHEDPNAVSARHIDQQFACRLLPELVGCRRAVRIAAAPRSTGPVVAARARGQTTGARLLRSRPRSTTSQRPRELHTAPISRRFRQARRL